MPLTLYTGPDPAAIRREVLRRTPTHQGCVRVLVPDTRSARDLERTAAELENGARMGIRTVTMDRLAAAIVEIDGPSPAIIGRHVRRTLLAEIIRGRMPGSRFAPVAEYPGFCDLVAAYLEDARSRGDGRVSGDRVLRSVAAAWEGHLARLGAADHEGIVLQALMGDRINRFAARCDTFIVLGFYDLTDRQFELVSRIVRVGHRNAVGIVYDPERPDLFRIPGQLIERFRALGARGIAVPCPPRHGADRFLDRFIPDGFDRSAERSADHADYGGNPGREGSPDGGVNRDGSVDIHTFRSEAAEADWIAGTIARMTAGGADPADIMIVTRGGLRHGSPLERALRRHRVPLEHGFPLRFADHPVARHALTALEAAVRPERRDCFLRVVRSSLTTITERNGPDGVDDRGWTCMIAETDAPAGHAAALLRILDALGTARACATLPATTGYPADEAYARLIDLIREFARVYRHTRPLMRAGEFLSLFRAFLAGVDIPDGAPAGRGVLAAEAMHARYHVRPVGFFAGLSADAVPARTAAFSLHNPDVAVELRERRAAEEPLLFYLSLRGAERIILTYPGVDDEGRDDAMSPYLRTAVDVLCMDAVTRHTAVSGAAWEGGAAGERARLERIIRLIRDSGPNMTANLSALETVDPAAAAAVARAARTAIHLAAVEGVDLGGHPSLASIRERWGGARPFAVTDLEAWIACPLRFFYERALGLRIDTTVPGELDPALRGSLAHEILAGFYRERIEAGALAVTAADRDDAVVRMHALVDEAFRRNAARLSDIHPAAVEVERRRLRDLLGRFVADEAAHGGTDEFLPSACEVSFGLERDGETYPPLVIPAGAGDILVGGRIDRIDIMAAESPPRVRVIDYKTGDVRISMADIEEGRALQAPLYLAACARVILPGAVPWESGYFGLRDMRFRTFNPKRNHPLEGEEWEPYLALAEQHAVRAASGITMGHFPPPVRDIRGCPHVNLCRGCRSRIPEDDNAADDT